VKWGLNESRHEKEGGGAIERQTKKEN